MFGKKFIRCIAITTIFMIILTSCAKTKVPRDTDAEIEEQNSQVEDELAEFVDDTLQMPDESVSAIVGTWQNTPDPKKEWMTSYKTCFSPDGRAVHYGFRNVDFGTWTQDGDIYTVYFDDCSYFGIDGGNHHVPSYTLTCWLEVSEDGEKKSLHRDTERETEISLEVETWDGIELHTAQYTAVDLDDYGCPLSYESGLAEVYEYASDYYSESAECSDLLKQGLLEIAGLLAEGTATEMELAALPGTLEDIVTYDFTGDGREEVLVHVEFFNTRADGGEEAIYIISPVGDGSYSILAENMDFKRGYTDILAPDGTELLSLGYASASSWKGGVRYHLGYREGEIVVDREESYWFHWDYPLINDVNDFKNGVFYVYVARNPQEGEVEGYGSYIELEDSIKIDEETFEPVFLPFTGHGWEEYEYPAVYSLCHPFSEDWWLDGGKYPEDGEAYGRGMADWIAEAEDDDPDEMLREAVEKSGYKMEKKAYPWTDETKENVVGLLRCPVANHYYISEDHVAYYARGEVHFVEIEQ